MRKLLRILVYTLVTLVVLVGAAVAWFFWSTSGALPGTLEAWAKTQVEATANTYLKPDLTFGSFDYRYPRTVVISDLRLVADSAGEPVEIFAAREVAIELLDIPAVGEPIRLGRVEVNGPRLVLRSASQADPSLIGWSDLLEPRGSRDDGPKEAMSISSFLQMEQVRIRKGSVQMIPADPSHPTMELDDLAANLDLDADVPGVYSVRYQAERPPVLTTRLEGTFDVDRLIANITRLDLELDAGGEAIRALPPSMQKLARDQQVQGRLDIEVRGKVNLGVWRQSELLVNVELGDASIVWAGQQHKVDRLAARVRMAGGDVRTEKFDVDVGEGRASATAELDLYDDMALKGEVTLHDLRLEDLIRDAEGNPKGAGRLNGHATFESPVESVLEKASGSGDVKITDGNFQALQLLTQLKKMIGVGAGTGKRGKDAAAAEFVFVGDHVRFEAFSAETATMFARGVGLLSFRGQLYCVINAGPVEKLQALLGPAGDLFGKMTDSITAYLVSGEVENPPTSVLLAPGPTRKKILSSTPGVLDELVPLKKEPSPDASEEAGDASPEPAKASPDSEKTEPSPDDSKEGGAAKADDAPEDVKQGGAAGAGKQGGQKTNVQPSAEASAPAKQEPGKLPETPPE